LPIYICQVCFVKIRNKREMTELDGKVVHRRCVGKPGIISRLAAPPFIPSDIRTVKAMLKFANVGPDDIVYDLGCGDGRILISAVKDFSARKAVGYELSEEVYKRAIENVKREGLEERIQIKNEDLFNADLSDASVITLYLNGTLNRYLEPKLRRECKRGTRIVSRTFNIPRWEPAERWRFNGSMLYLYRIPDAFASPQF